MLRRYGKEQTKARKSYKAVETLSEQNEPASRSSRMEKRWKDKQKDPCSTERISYLGAARFSDSLLLSWGWTAVSGLQVPWGPCPSHDPLCQPASVATPLWAGQREFLLLVTKTDQWKQDYSSMRFYHFRSGNQSTQWKLPPVQWIFWQLENKGRGSLD